MSCEQRVMAAAYLRTVVVCAVTALFLCLYMYSECYTTAESSTTTTKANFIRSHYKHKFDQELQYRKQPEAGDVSLRPTSTLVKAAVQSDTLKDSSFSPPHLRAAPLNTQVAHQSTSPQTMSQVHRDRTFTVARDFTFPHPQVFKPVNVVLACGWVRELKQYLSSVDPVQPVTVTVASYDFAANLLNWLISAQVMTSPPLENILVISFDNTLHKMLVRRQISSVCVPYISVLRNAKSLGIHKVWMTRLAVIRLINHWGFDVQQFDTDAIIRRNPQPLFDSFPGFDVVGSRAKLPFELGKGQWGFTVCMGVIVFRSTPRTGESWRSLFHYNTYDSSISIQST